MAMGAYHRKDPYYYRSELAPPQREQWIDQLCGDMTGMRRRVYNYFLENMSDFAGGRVVLADGTTTEIFNRIAPSIYADLEDGFNHGCSPHFWVEWAMHSPIFAMMEKGSLVCYSQHQVLGKITDITYYNDTGRDVNGNEVGACIEIYHHEGGTFIGPPPKPIVMRNEGGVHYEYLTKDEDDTGDEIVNNFKIGLGNRLEKEQHGCEDEVVGVSYMPCCHLDWSCKDLITFLSFLPRSTMTVAMPK